MRTKLLALVSTLTILALLLPVCASAKRITAAGSLAITKITEAGDVDLTNELVVTTVMSNPGLEKTVTQQLPLPGQIYVLPFFVDQEKGNSGSGNLETSLALTNTTNVDLSIKLTLRGSDGAVLGSPHPFTLDPYETRLISLSDLLD